MYNARSSYVNVIYPWPEFSLFLKFFYNPYLQFLNVSFLVSPVDLASDIVKVHVNHIPIMIVLANLVIVKTAVQNWALFRFDVMYMYNMPFHCSCCFCLSSTNLCGWCLYDKKCTSSSDQCRVSTDWINVSSTSIISVMS